jgi:hypothetical protein
MNTELLDRPEEGTAVTYAKREHEPPGISCQADASHPTTGHALRQGQRRLQLGPVRHNPLVCGVHSPGGTRVAQSDHRRVTFCGASLDPAPTAILPPQDRLHDSTTVNRAIGVTHRAQPMRCRGEIVHRRAKIQILPAHMRHVMDTSTRRGDIPIEEGDRQQQAPTAVPIHGVLGRQVVVTNHLLVTGQWRSGRQVVELANESSNLHQALDRVHAIGRGLPGDIAVHERQDLASLLIQSEHPRSACPPVLLEMTKQSMDQLGTISKTASHRISYPDDAVDEATRQRNLNHSPSLDDRYRIFA